MKDDRFIRAQSYEYAEALEQMQKGRKTSHWIWFIFPQIQGLGESTNARYYALNSIEETKEYFEDPLLHDHLIEITTALLTHKGEDIELIMGSSIDALKVRSSMTLFYVVTKEPLFKEVLDVFFNGQQDPMTIHILEMI